MAPTAFSLARPLTTLPPDGPGKPCGLLVSAGPRSTVLEAFLISTGIVALAAMGVFLLVLVVGFVYEWKKGALEWE